MTLNISITEATVLRVVLLKVELFLVGLRHNVIINPDLTKTDMTYHKSTHLVTTRAFHKRKNNGSQVSSCSVIPSYLKTCRTLFFWRWISPTRSLNYSIIELIDLQKNLMSLSKLRLLKFNTNPAFVGWSKSRLNRLSCTLTRSD